MEDEDVGVQPFEEGDIVRSKGNPHFGDMRVDSCEWVQSARGPYWLVVANEIREPIDWSKIPAGSTGIVMGGQFRAAGAHYELVRRRRS